MRMETILIVPHPKPDARLVQVIKGVSGVVEVDDKRSPGRMYVRTSSPSRSAAMTTIRRIEEMTHCPIVPFTTQFFTE